MPVSERNSKVVYEALKAAESKSPVRAIALVPR
jgi:hypothetical protein